MKLLIITQKVDRHDDVLGFFHNWIEKLAGFFAGIAVVCLERGDVNLPGNVHVMSLGKEKGCSRLQYVLNFYRYITRERKNYDAVFVHMNAVYVVLGGLLWKLWKKKVFMWYNHEYGNALAKAAVKLVRTAFYTSSFSFASRYLNSKRMPAGIDTDIFAPDNDVPRIENALLYVGRIAAIKKVDVLVDAVSLLEQKGIDVVLQIAGAPGKGDEEYYQDIRRESAEIEQAGKIRFLGKVPNHATPELYQRSQILFNLSPPGLFDKTVMEAMACRCLVLVSSPAFKEMLPDECMFREGDSEDLASKIEGLLQLPAEQRQESGKGFRQRVVESHSLKSLVEKLTKECAE